MWFQVEVLLLNAKALSPEELPTKIANLQQIIMAINSLSKVLFCSLKKCSYRKTFIFFSQPLLGKLLCSFSYALLIRLHDMTMWSSLHLILFQGFSERLVTASRPAIGLMFKQVGIWDNFRFPVTFVRLWYFSLIRLMDCYRRMLIWNYSYWYFYLLFLLCPDTGCPSSNTNCVPEGRVFAKQGKI